MKLYRFHTRLNRGQDWTKYDVLAPDLKSALALAERVVRREEGITGKPVKFQDQTSGPKEVEVTGVETLSDRVWRR